MHQLTGEGREGAVGVRRSAERFLHAYRAAFEAFDARALEALFSYPCLITSGAESVDISIFFRAEDFFPQLKRLVLTYQAIGVRKIERIAITVVELTPLLAQVGVRWRLIDVAGAPLYEFDAAYMLADRGQGMRIASIAHNELPHLRSVIEARRLRGDRDVAERYVVEGHGDAALRHSERARGSA
jgi:hypothetical protein